MNDIKQEEWEKEFEEKFIGSVRIDGSWKYWKDFGDPDSPAPWDIQDFIRTLIKKKQLEVVERAGRLLKGLTFNNYDNEDIDWDVILFDSLKQEIEGEDK